MGGIEANVGSRLARLGADCTSLAWAAAVLGPGTPLRRAATLPASGEKQPGGSGEALRGTGLLTSDQPLSLVHPIVADAGVAGILPSGLAAMHTAAAQLLLADGAAANQVAAHLIHAEPFGEPWVVAALRTAAHQALSQGAPQPQLATFAGHGRAPAARGAARPPDRARAHRNAIAQRFRVRLRINARGIGRSPRTPDSGPS